MDVTTVVLVLLALAAGAVIGWLVAGQRAAAAVLTATQEAAVVAERSVRERAAEQAEAAAEQARIQAESAAARAELESELAALHASLAGERAAAQDREALLASTEKQLREAFVALSAEALAKNNEAFVAMAESRLASAKASADGDLAQRQQAIDALVAPLRESLDRVQQQIGEVEKDRTGSYSALRQQLGSMQQTSEQLRSETSQLVNALRAPQVRGRWGELQLERAVEAAGLTEHIDYVTQASSTTDDGTLRPDLVVQLTGGKSVVVDSKVAFAGYLEAMEARDEATRAARLKAHARHMRTHIDSLAAKAYWERFSPSPEFVVCFIPADAFLDAALREDPTLLEHAFSKNVILATPSTLIALLRTVAYTWRQDALATNAAEVHQLGRELYQRLSTMGSHVDKLGKSLGNAVAAYNSTVTSLESRVFVTARKLTELKVETTDSLKAPEQLTEATRTTQANELTQHRVVALNNSRPTVVQNELPVAVIDELSAELIPARPAERRKATGE
ncbi:DNA recombination protein RmuC [Frankineae bacterium MT45]|nr:DNA recombination protein RmuC [Frankineae bacterium MT45]